jgi:hypothetical protein
LFPTSGRSFCGQKHASKHEHRTRSNHQSKIVYTELQSVTNLAGGAGDEAAGPGRSGPGGGGEAGGPPGEGAWEREALRRGGWLRGRDERGGRGDGGGGG